MFTYVAVVAFLVTGIGFTQQQSGVQGCPIEIVGVFPRSFLGGLGSGPANGPDHLLIKYRNISGKDIRAAKFGALFFNALDEPTESYTNYIDSNILKWDSKRAADGKPQKDQEGYWTQYDDTVSLADAYVKKVKFIDGTFWEDDGSYSCNAGLPDLKIAKGGGLKAFAAAIKDLQLKTQHGRNDDEKKPTSVR